MNECDHILGFNYNDGRFMHKSNIHVFAGRNLCDADLDIYFKFCPECGEKLNEE